MNRVIAVARVAGVCTALVAMGQVWAPSQAAAEIYTCGSTSPYNYHVGYSTTPETTSETDFVGVRMEADVQNAQVCDTIMTASNFTNVYQMIKGNPDYANEGYAQSGYIRWYGSGDYDFAQTYKGTGTSFPTYYSPSTISTGTTRGYRSEFEGVPCLCEAELAHGSAVLQTSYNPESQWVAPLAMELSAEAAYKQSDIVGVSSNQAKLADLKYQSYSDENFYAMPCSIFTTYSDSTRWNHNSVSCTQKNLWTDPLS